MRENLDWFGEHLRVPKLRGFDCRARFWFRSEAVEFIHRAWALSVVLASYDLEICCLRTADPGVVVYRDAHQVAAFPRIDSRELQRRNSR